MSRAALPKLTAEHRRLLGDLVIAKVQLSLAEADKLPEYDDHRRHIALHTELLLVQLTALLSGVEAAHALYKLLDWAVTDTGRPYYEDADATRWYLAHVRKELAQLTPELQPQPDAPTSAPVIGQKGIM